MASEIFVSPSGTPLRGQNVGDILIWNGSSWEPGPGSSGPPRIVPAFDTYEGEGFGFDNETLVLEVTWEALVDGANYLAPFALNLTNAEGFAGAPAEAMVRLYIDGFVANPTGFFVDWMPSSTGRLQFSGAAIVTNYLDDGEPTPIAAGIHTIGMTVQRTSGTADALAVQGISGPSPTYLGIGSW